MSGRPVSSHLNNTPKPPLQNILVLNTPGILRLSLLNESLSRYHQYSESEFWNSWALEFFSADASFKIGLCHSSVPDRKSFDLVGSLIPKYFLENYAAGLRQLSFSVENVREIPFSTSGCVLLDSSRSLMTQRFEHGSHVMSYGHLRIMFHSDLKIESFEFFVLRHEEVIPRNFMLAKLNPTKNRNVKGVLDGIIHSSPVNDYGICIRAMRFLELAEVFSSMADLISFSLDKMESPLAALADFPKTVIPSLSTSEVISGPQQPIITSDSDYHNQQNPEDNLNKSSLLLQQVSNLEDFYSISPPKKKPRSRKPAKSA